jgi:hypothetical protein
LDKVEEENVQVRLGRRGDSTVLDKEEEETVKLLYL